MKKMVWDRSEIKTFENVFEREDFMKMTDHMRYPNWSYGNISNPNAPSLWAPFSLPSIWVWQLLFLGYGIFVMWFLAFHMGMSEPIDPEKVKSQPE